MEHRPDHLRCVFNVKKRSWKGGIQVSIDLAHAQLVQAREQIGFDSWLQEQLRNMGQEERVETTQRADDLFIQSLCTCALNLALQAGLEQQNQVVDASTFVTELAHLIQEAPADITERIRLELDLTESPDHT